VVADLGVGCCGLNDQADCVHVVVSDHLELCVGQLARGGHVCKLRQAALVQYHNYLIPGPQVQTIDIQAG
jgi:hypothetical protein